MVFGVYLNSVTLDGPLVQTVLYLHDPSSEANPKAISERTSYLQVRLEFTATHNSSQHFSTYMGSVLQCVSPHLQPGHG